MIGLEFNCFISFFHPFLITIKCAYIKNVQAYLSFLTSISDIFSLDHINTHVTFYLPNFLISRVFPMKLMIINFDRILFFPMGWLLVMTICTFYFVWMTVNGKKGRDKWMKRAGLDFWGVVNWINFFVHQMVQGK